jgi:hypothetical protein
MVPGCAPIRSSTDFSTEAIANGNLGIAQFEENRALSVPEYTRRKGRYNTFFISSG